MPGEDQFGLPMMPAAQVQQQLHVLINFRIEIYELQNIQKECLAF